jgi:hypothetical protein
LAITLPDANVERGVKVRGPVALVVMRSPLRSAGHERQDRCGPIEGLDLGLLVDAQHDCRVRRVQRETDDVADLVDGQRIW